MKRPPSEISALQSPNYPDLYFMMSEVGVLIGYYWRMSRLNHLDAEHREIIARKERSKYFNQKDELKRLQDVLTKSPGVA